MIPTHDASRIRSILIKWSRNIILCLDVSQIILSFPLEKGDRPKINDTELLDSEEIVRYQSLIGSSQWTISLGQMDV